MPARRPRTRTTLGPRPSTYEHGNTLFQHTLSGNAVNDFRVAKPVDRRFVLDPFEPAYTALPTDEIAGRVAAGHRELLDCCACPRNCHVNRMANETTICNTGRYARVASAFAHFGEEDCLRGWRGSGTIFFSLCNLRCVEIDRRPDRDELSSARRAARDAGPWRFDQRWLG